MQKRYTYTNTITPRVYIYYNPFTSHQINITRTSNNDDYSMPIGWNCYYETPSNFKI